MKKRHIQKLILISVILLLALNMPVVLLFNSAGSVLGIPAILFYVFSVWGMSAIVSLIIIKRYGE
jgi:hypothetical protein